MKIPAPNYTQTPNDLFDHWLPHLSESELKVLLVILRKTFGWHKVRDRISLSQLVRHTGLHKESVILAGKTLQEKGIILKNVTGENGTQQTYYEIVVDEDSNNSDRSEDHTPPSRNDRTTPPVGNSDPQKKTYTKETAAAKETASPIAAASSSQKKEMPKCLADLNIPAEDKEFIWNDCNALGIENAVRSYLPQAHKVSNVRGWFKAACERNYEPIPDKKEADRQKQQVTQDIIDKNREYAKKLQKTATLSDDVGFKIDETKVTISTYKGQVSVLGFLENGFCDQLENILRKHNAKLKPK